jgi:hypothetical protein
MSIDFIELLDSHIMATENVIIEEERIKDEYNIYFNDAQIKSHLTNLVYDGKKVSTFFDLLDQRNPQRTPYTKHIMPIISCKKHIYYIDDDEYEPDQDFEEEQQIIMNNFDDFMIQFDAMNHDARNKYSMTKERFDNLMRPFVTTGTPNHTIGDSSVDGMDALNRRYRMIPNDQVKLVGFYTGSEDRQEIHIAKYLKRLRKLRDNDDVRVMFNDFAFRNNKLVIKAKATVRGDKVVFDKPIYLQTPDVMTSSLPINDDRFFVFPAGKPSFSKYAILMGNYAVYGEDPVQLNEFIMPSSVTQALFIQYRSGAIKTYRDLSAYVLEEAHRHVINWIMRPKTKQGALSSPRARRARMTSNPPQPPPPRDRYRAAFLANFKEYLASLQRKFDKGSLGKQINKIRGELELLKDAAESTCSKVVARPIKIIKTFSSVTELNADLDAFRENEYVILQQPLFARDELFVMKSVQGSNQWVKVRNLDKCDTDILIVGSQKNIAQDLCMYDSAEQACQYLENIWMLRKKQAKERHLKILEDISWLLEHGADDINALIAFFEMINKHDIMRNIPFDATFHGHYEKIVADEDLYGEDLPMTFEELMNFTEGNEMPRPLQQQPQQKGVSNPTELDNVTIISKYLDINFTSDHLSFMKQYVSRRFDKTFLDEQLVAERTRLMAPINQTMYQNNRDYKNKVDTKIEERLRAFMEKKYEKFYYDEIIFSAALIQCMILALYPAAEMSKIVPRCSALYSSTGHPIASDGAKSLESYLACALKQMAIEDDIRYKLVISSDRVADDIKSSIDAILIEDYSLSQRITNNKQTKSSPRRITRIMEAPLNVSYRPAFNFPVHTNDDTILFLKTLNDVVARSKYNKINMKKSAFISNVCCPELLTNEYDTYDMFTGEVRDMNTVRQKTAFINHSRTTFPPLHAQHLKDPFKEPKVTHHKWMRLTYDEARDIVIDPIEDDEFNEVIYPRLNANFEKLSTLLLKILDKPNMAALYFIRDALINNMNNDSKLHRMVLHNFLVNKLPLQVSKWINGIANSTDELDKTVRSNTDVRELLNDSWPFVKVFADTIVVSGAEDECIKDIIMLLDSLFVFLTHLSVTAGENMRSPNIKLVHTLIDTMITKMHEYYQNNIFDNKDVLKNIEELRELKKQSMMDAYAVDDEERTIQIQLRNIGVTNWQSIFDRMKNVDLTDMNAQREENENYRMGDYAGENDEADEINEDVY